jgi:thymidylate synthase
MNDPVTIITDSFQEAWLKAIIKLREHNWEMYNLFVNIKNPSLLNNELNNDISKFLKNQTTFSAKDVAYTIFPHTLYKQYNNKKELFSKYMSIIYPWTRKKTHRGWGTYFARMINYERDNKIVNQLENIINAINDRDNTSKAAFTIIIEKPGGETIRPIGAPCLNFIAVQMEHINNNKYISLLCVYRNHDFLSRTYGNYWGLCNLLNFLAKESNSKIGGLTCISSHAYVPSKKRKLTEFVNDILSR